MGLLDIFGGSKGAFRKHATRAGNKRAQAPDRWDSLRILAGMGTGEAAEALLERFTFKVDPSITDQDEKDLALEGVVAAGDEGVEPTIRFLHRAESISWPVKVLQRLVPEDRVVAVLLEVLGKMDTEYQRDPERKLQVLSFLGERADDRIAPAVERFLDDMDESVRFQAASCLFQQGKDRAGAAREPLVTLLEREESVRVRERVLQGFVEYGWKLPPDRLETLRGQLPDGWQADRSGTLKQRS